MLLLRSAISVLALPFTVTVIVPMLLLGGEAPASPFPSRVAGALLVLVGAALAAVTIRHFAKVGRGTLAPWDPPRRLVVTGIYRHVRNPMITGVVLILVGEALWFGSSRIAAWALVFFAVNALYVPLVEEPGLRRRFGDEYGTYLGRVPRWVPRLTPWEPGSPADGPPDG